MTISYTPTDINEVTVLFRWTGTIFPAVLLRPAIWILMIAHYSFFYMHMHTDITMPVLPWKIVGLPTGLLTFFLVFYGGNCYSRFYALYKDCIATVGCAMEWASLVKTHFGAFASPVTRCQPHQCPNRPPGRRHA